MIDGITVLSQSEIMTHSYPFWSEIVLGLFAFTLAMTAKAFFESDMKGIGTVFTISALIIGGYMLVRALQTEPSGTYQYKVLIRDDVSFTDIRERYTVMNQDGQIYTIRLKEGTNADDQ